MFEILKYGKCFICHKRDKLVNCITIVYRPNGSTEHQQYIFYHQRLEDVICFPIKYSNSEIEKAIATQQQININESHSLKLLKTANELCKEIREKAKL